VTTLERTLLYFAVGLPLMLAKLNSFQQPVRAACIAIGLTAAAMGLGQDVNDLPPDLGTREEGHDWPGFLGPRNNARSDETGLHWNWSDDLPPIQWTVRLGTGYSPPSVSRGRLFHFDRYGDQNRLTCRHSETGDELWTYEYATAYEDLLGYNNGPRCTPVVDGPRVYVFGQEGELHCVRVRDGQRLWSVDTAEKFHVVQNFFGVGSTPIVVGDLLIVQVGGSPPGGPVNVYSGYVKPNQQAIVAFDKLTGEVRYSLADELASYAGPVAATIDGRPWCFVFARGGLVGFNPQTGEQDFHYPWRARLLESVNAANPVVVEDQVLISECYGPGSSLLAARPGGYEVVWKDGERSREKILRTHWCTPVYHDGYVYASSGRHSGEAELRCVEWKTGKVAWSTPGLRRASLLYADGHFIVLSEDGVLRLIKANPEQYDLQAEVLLRDENNRPLLRPPAWSPPVLAHGLLYVRGDDRLVCLDLAAASGSE
jgi:outer membrane protein assembly factor BamB